MQSLDLDFFNAVLHAYSSNSFAAFRITSCNALIELQSLTFDLIIINFSTSEQNGPINDDPRSRRPFQLRSLNPFAADDFVGGCKCGHMSAGLNLLGGISL